MSFPKKLALILSGVLSTLIILEIGLRLTGFIIVSIQEHRNLQAIKQKGTYRIMCLGESTTAGQWPPFLEQILNQRNTGIRFSVIDKGITGTNTSGILGQLESSLDTYQPDMVIAMMGMNDSYIKYYEGIPFTDTAVFRELRTCRFALMIWKQVVDKANRIVTPNFKENTLVSAARYRKSDTVKTEPVKTELKPITENITLTVSPQNENTPIQSGKIELLRGDSSQNQEALKKAIEFKPESEGANVESGLFYKNQNKLPQAEASFKKAIALDPGNDKAYIELAGFYESQNKLSQAQEAFKKAIELNPHNDKAYIGLGLSYKQLGDLHQAEESFKKAVELNPKNATGHFELGIVYREEASKFFQAEESFKKAIELNPEDGVARLALGELYVCYGRYAQAEASFKEVIKLGSQGEKPFTLLGEMYMQQGKFPQAEEAFKKAIELNPHNERLLGALSALYAEMRKPEFAAEYEKKTNGIRLRRYGLLTINNYHNLKEILDKRGVRLVCVQYPMRSIEPLKKIFQGKEEGVIFVDNEKVFKNALKQGGYKQYFIDMFAGDFGHCTDKGNKLLAENIANVILKEVFKK